MKGKQLMIADYHLHTRFSSDCEVNPEHHIKRAIELGMNELCFTDHVDFDYPKEDGKTMFRIDAQSYFEELLKYKEQYATKIKIKIGIEAGLNRSTDKDNTNLIAAYPFDFVIGSSHIVDGNDPYYSEFWENITPKEAINKYYNAVLSNVTFFNDYDIYGHLDYIRRYIPDSNFVYSLKDFTDIADMILKNIIAKGHGIELNTRGLRNGITEFVPTIMMLSRYRELGGEIVTVGSDAHVSEDLGYGFKTAQDILINTGFKYYTTFENRTPLFIPLT